MIVEEDQEEKQQIVPKFSSYKSKKGNIKNETNAKSTFSRDDKRATVTSKPKDQLKQVQKSQVEILSDLQDSRELFVVDKKGDVGNLVYRRVHSYGVPLFKRTGFGKVLGISNSNTINRNNEPGTIVLSSNDKGPLNRNKKERILLLPISDVQESEHITAASLADGRCRQHDDYLPLVGDEGKASDSASSSSSDENTPSKNVRNGRGIRTYGVNESLSRHTQEENAKLLHLVKSQPKNVRAWLALIKHQDMMIRLGRESSRPTLTKDERHALAEIRVSIYEQALAQIDNDSCDHTLLVLGLIREGSNIWSPSRKASQWKAALSKYPKNYDLWIGYINYAQTDLAHFTFENCKSHYLDCLDVFSKTFLSKPSDKTASLHESRIYLHIILRSTCLMHDSGYSEHAAAIWQALIELHFFAPKELEDDVHLRKSAGYPSNYLDEFESFWDSEVPRIGENGSSGWDAFHRHGDNSAQQVDAVNEKRQPGIENLFEEFAEFELLCTRESITSGRTSDETDLEEDPYHVILFSDLLNVLKHSPLLISKKLVVEAFLCFCGLPTISQRDQTSPKLWSEDHFLRRFAIGTVTSESANTGFLSNIRITTETLFSEAFVENTITVDKSWIQRVLRSLVNVLQDDDNLSEYYLAFTERFFPSRVLKEAKTLLKKRPSSLRLYNAYGILHAKLGNNESSDKVFSTAISMLKTLPNADLGDTVLLYRTWIWEALHKNDLQTALKRTLQLTSIAPASELATPRVESSNQMDILQCKKGLESGQTDMISQGKFAQACLFLECLALLNYLSQAQNISIVGALQTFHPFLEYMKSQGLEGSAVAEVAHQARANLLEYHIKHSHFFQPAQIRSELSESIALFPNNTMFLRMYTENEARFRIDDRVRTIMRNVVLREGEESIVGWMFACWAERTRENQMGSTVHSARATFERAVESESGKSSSFLWISFVLFELSHNDPSRTKEVFLRGLLRLPWVKDYMMLAFTRLRHILSFEELRSIYNTMLEKEIRLHVDISQQLEQIRDSKN